MVSRRIILAGEFWFGSTGAGLAHGLRNAGNIVFEADMRHYFPASTNPASKIAFRMLNRQFINSYKRHIRNLAVQGGNEILITIKGSFLDPGILSDLREKGLFLVNFYPDVAFDHPGFQADWLAGYDLIATTKAFQLDYLATNYGAEKIAFVPHGYSTLVHRPHAFPSDDSAFDYDLAYIGNASAHKAKLLAAIAEAFPDKLFLLAGGGWEQYVQGTALQSCVRMGPIVGDQYADVITRSRINLAVHYGPAGSHGWEDSVSTRSFEIPACGGFMLHVDNPEIRGLFKEGEEVVLFSDPVDAIAKIHHYLVHTDQRMAIARRGYQRCVPAYSLDARAKELMHLIEKRIGRA